MIEPTSKDTGRFVVYIDNVNVDYPIVESGRISGFNEQVVFVLFPNTKSTFTTPLGCNREQLFWLSELVRILPDGAVDALLTEAAAVATDLLAMERGKLDREGLPWDTVVGDRGRRLMAAVDRVRKS